MLEAPLRYGSIKVYLNRALLALPELSDCL